MTLIALSAAYGAGGSRVGPLLAQRLGVAFVDRAIPAGVSEELEVPLDEALSHDERRSGGWVERMLTGFIGLDNSGPSPVPADVVTSEDFRQATERMLRDQAATGAGVILGRAAVIVLRDEPNVVRVRLDGPAELRVQQAMALVGVSRETAERRVRRLDQTHAAYAEHFYGAKLADSSLYHLMLDSTAIELETCVELIELAAGAMRARG